MEKALNEQMTQEAWQAQVYFSYASWAESNHFGGLAGFLFKHMREEREHMFKFAKYILNRGGKVNVAPIKAAPADPKDLGQCLKALLDHEVKNSKLIDEIVNLAHKEKDWPTFNFANWFVKEQIEEETLFSELLDRYVLATSKGDANLNLYGLDRDLMETPQEVTIPRNE